MIRDGLFKLGNAVERGLHPAPARRAHGREELGEERLCGAHPRVLLQQAGGRGIAQIEAGHVTAHHEAFVCRRRPSKLSPSPYGLKAKFF